MKKYLQSNEREEGSWWCDNGVMEAVVSSPSLSAGNKGCKPGVIALHPHRRRPGNNPHRHRHLPPHHQQSKKEKGGGSPGSESVTGTVAAIVTKPKGSNPFGKARPREEVLAEKGQDWKKIDDQLESLKIKEVNEKPEGGSSLLFKSMSHSNDRDFLRKTQKVTTGKNSEPTVKTFDKNATSPKVAVGNSVPDVSQGGESDNLLHRDENVNY
ncbi:hypothetical protein F8388_025329 [Cannabis sativa]|uniref:Uncharacterized protein n=1 Tax=Cannabis sativa TaxID=3483 RepID=A0A7J6FSH8_CANSA|nr:hypothetical protein F8388_025329 [Cannabis sativa]